jgi:uncharacterized protein
MSDKNSIIHSVASSLKLEPSRAEAAVQLLDDGATVPFIARYRKELTGGMDEVVLIELRNMMSARRELEARRLAVLKSLKERDLLTAELERAVLDAQTRLILEDIYLPYRPKRRTRATAAREAGLEGLADEIFSKQDGSPDPEAYLNPEAGIDSPEAALAGARDILAERFSEDAASRSALRNMSQDRGTLCSQVVSKKKDDDKALVYRDYFDYEEKLSRVPSHRILAVLRGNHEGFLRVKAGLDAGEAAAWLEGRLVRGRGSSAEQVKMAVKDGWIRLLGPSLETEILGGLKEKADAEAIRVFAQNLGKMLMAPPLGSKAVVAVDPGFRTGGKVAVLNPQGLLLEHGVVHPEGSESARRAAAQTLKLLAEKHKCEVFAVGNGTAGRETEEFIREAIPGSIVVSVDERGASVYSASEEARREFGGLDLTVRGAVSIGRRLQDPLAELVKIDPAAIGVGQYQHDVDSSSLAAALDDTVRSAVNAVGVELNNASPALLSRVSGLGPALALAVVDYRDKNGPFRRRKQLLKVPRLGERAYEQAAAFLRIRDGAHPLDGSAVHPERYALVEKMAADLGVKLKDLMESGELRSKIRLEDYVSPAGGVGLPTLRDILAELARPGRDPRGTYSPFSFDQRIRDIGDVEVGMVVPGIVTNVTAFGAFVDIGAHRDGLVHISQLAARFVSDPSEVVSVNDQVMVKVMEVDMKRGRLGLSMKEAP